MTLAGMEQEEWRRLKESQVRESRAMLPARVVLDHREPDGTYRTFLEVLPENGLPRFQYGRIFESEEEAEHDFQKGAARL